MESKNILIINQTFYPDNAATAQHLTDLARFLKANGYEVTVLTSRRGYANPQKIYPPREIYEGINIKRVGTFFLGRSQKWQRVVEALIILIQFMWELLWAPRYSKVMALTSPPMVGFFAAAYAYFKKSELIYWVMDINPDEAIEAGWIKKKSLQAKSLEKALVFILKHCKKIIVLDEFMKQKLIDKAPECEKSIRVIPPWSHDDYIQPVRPEDNEFRKTHGLTDKFIVMYSGNHSICHPLDTLLEAAVRLKDHASIKFVFIGGGQRTQDVAWYKTQYNLDNVVQLPYQSREMVKFSLSAANLHVVVMGNPYVGIVHPCKIYDILSLAKPFVYIGPVKSHIGQMLQRLPGHYQAVHGDAGAVVAAVLAAQSKPAHDRERCAFEAQEFSRQFRADGLLKQLMSFIDLHSPT